MKNSLAILFLILPFFILTACSKNDEQANPELTVSKETVDFSSSAGTQSISITSNVAGCTVKSDKSWCHPSISGKNLKIEVDESDERLVREATVTISSGNLAKNVKVRQLGYEAAILVDQQLFEVNAVGGEIKFNVTTNIEVQIALPDWIRKKPEARAAAMVTTEYTYLVTPSQLDDKRQGNITITEILPEDAAENTVAKSAIVSVYQNGLNNYTGGTGEDILGDIKIPVKSGTASSYQGGSNIENSFDGDYNTLYHSNWTNSGNGYFPITLTYNFDQAADVDYLVYYPRTDGYNGRFKEVDIQYSADGNSFVPLLTKDFAGSGTAIKVVFDNQVHAKSFRFIVKSGAGDGQGFASCAEMEFYAKKMENFQWETLFTDQTCSELKPSVTQSDIDNCQYPFFKNLAYYMLQGSYSTEFRVAEYKSYPNPDIQSGINKTNAYSQLDNPTGISVKAAENLIVMVGDTHGYDISIRVQDLDLPGGDGFGGASYPLSEGLNKLTMNTKGLVYVMYHTSTLDDTNAKPVKIHFASGTVNGYYDSQNEKYKNRWSELLGKASDRYFDVVGQYAHLTFETADFRKYAASTGKDLIDAYDQIVYSEAQLLGLLKYKEKMFRNRMYLNVMYHSYMYATSYHTGYERGTMSEICNPVKLKTGGCWGPAHEIGHCNQTRPGVLWVGNTEVTNNIMSEYIQTTIFNQSSRIQTEDMGEMYRNRYSKAWTEIIAGERPHCDFGGANDKNDVFCKLVPFWQLELYFGKVLGKTPLKQSDFGGFYPEVYEYARTKNYSGMTNGEVQLDFVYNCCVASQTNLLDFFEKWGFLSPVDKLIEDYSKEQLTVTETMIAELKAKVTARGYPTPDVALEYISDNTFALFGTKPSVVKGSNATHLAVNNNNEKITISGWKNVVTYEVKDENGKLFFICSGETEPSDTDSFTIPVRWKEGFKLYAVSATGTRVEVPVN